MNNDLTELMKINRLKQDEVKLIIYVYQTVITGGCSRVIIRF